MCSDKYDPDHAAPVGYVHLQEYLEKLITEKFETYQVRLEGMDKAIVVAREQMAKEVNSTRIQLEKEVALARVQNEKEVALASGLMETRMNGFPDQFVRKGDSDVALTEIKFQVSMLSTITNKIDLSTLMPRSEYNIQHQQLSEKIGEAQVDIAEKTELASKTIEEKTSTIKDNSDLKFSAMERRVQEVENLRSNINGRLWALGVGGTVLIFVLEFLIKYVWKVG